MPVAGVANLVLQKRGQWTFVSGEPRVDLRLMRVFLVSHAIDLVVRLSHGDEVTSLRKTLLLGVKLLFGRRLEGLSLAHPWCLVNQMSVSLV